MGRLIIREEYKTPFVSVFGQIDRHFTAVHLPGLYSLGILMKPTVLSRLLRVDMSEFTNKAFDGELIRPYFKLLHQQIEEATSIRQKIAVLENFLLTALNHVPSHMTLEDQALQLIHQHHRITIPKLAYHLGVSDRQLEMSFKRTIGLSPKAYSLILRFKRMEQKLKTLSSIHWHDMTFASEYYDQNHFIKDFKRYTGLTPSTYLIENLEMGRSYLNVH